MLEHSSTTVAAAPMPKAFDTWVETASVGQVPSTRTSTGFSLMMPLVRVFSLLIFPRPLSL